MAWKARAQEREKQLLSVAEACKQGITASEAIENAQKEVYKLQTVAARPRLSEVARRGMGKLLHKPPIS